MFIDGKNDIMIKFYHICFEFLWAYKLKVYEQKNENQQRTERRNSTEVKTLIKVSCESTFVFGLFVFSTRMFE